MTKARRAKVNRKTKETDIQLSLNLDGRGRSKIDTGIAFLDHMLELFAKHGCFDLEIKAKGDLAVDLHHSNEDIGICLGQAFNQALADRKGIQRFGENTIPMDETLVHVRSVVDISGRPYFNNIKCEKAYQDKPAQGGYDLNYARQFFQALVNNFPITLHINILEPGSDAHHLLEAIFKAAGRTLDKATQIDPRIKGIPSTKGRL